MRLTRWFCTGVAALLLAAFLLTTAPSASAMQIHRRVIVVQPFAPYYWGPYWGYPYPYGSYYAANYGEVKIDTHRKDLNVYIDGGYAAQIAKDKKFTLRPGNHQIELRNSDGQTVYSEDVAVIVGKTTKIHVA